MAARLDLLGERTRETNEQIRQMNAKLDETNRRLESIDKSLKRFAPGNGNTAAGQEQLQQ
jgi:hypothetical protein